MCVGKNETLPPHAKSIRVVFALNRSANAESTVFLGQFSQFAGVS